MPYQARRRGADAERRRIQPGNFKPRPGGTVRRAGKRRSAESEGSEPQSRDEERQHVSDGSPEDGIILGSDTILDFKEGDFAIHNFISYSLLQVYIQTQDYMNHISRERERIQRTLTLASSGLHAPQPTAYQTNSTAAHAPSHSVTLESSFKSTPTHHSFHHIGGQKFNNFVFLILQSHWQTRQDSY